MTEQEQRAAVVAEARTWLKTPYHHQGFVKGGGVDCAFLLVKTYFACGLIPDIDPRPYPPDWHLHRGEEKYLEWVERYAVPVDVPQPGDVAMYQFGHCRAHGAIVVEWPTIIHAFIGEGCVLAEGNQGRLSGRLRGFWSLWGK